MPGMPAGFASGPPPGGSISPSQLASQAAYTVLGNNTAGTASPTAVAPSAWVATTSAAGFMSAADKLITDNLAVGFVAAGRRSVSGNITIDADDNILLITANADITLPSASDGRVVTLKKTTATVITVNILRAGSENIENVAANYAVTSMNSALYVALSLYCDGTNWWIL